MIAVDNSTRLLVDLKEVIVHESGTQPPYHPHSSGFPPQPQFQLPGAPFQGVRQGSNLHPVGISGSFYRSSLA